MHSDVLSQVSNTSVVGFLMLGISVRIQGLGAQIWSQTGELSGAPIKAERVAVVTTSFLLAATYADAGCLLLEPGMVDSFHLALVKENIFAHMKPCKTFTF